MWRGSIAPVVRSTCLIDRYRSMVSKAIPWLATAKLAKIEAADDRTEFPLAWALKDLELTRAPVGSDAASVALAVTERWRALVERGLGGLDVKLIAIRVPGLPSAPQAARRSAPTPTPA